ncbi:MAG TPA: redox-regulated ATPase YchF [Oscillospiraceae bacterium]|nr:redox-regulated ATPase YchF [Oscillospiraceae bacterium]
MKLGIIGLPNVGKSTLFNAITNAGAQVANYPFCTIVPNVGVVAVPEPRLDRLAELYDPEKYTPATVEFVDIAGLVKGASKGEGLGNKFLANIREVDALIHVVRCFEDPNVVHVDGSVSASRDIETINLELVFSDLEVLERRISKVEKEFKGGNRQYADEHALLGRLRAFMEAGNSARAFPTNDDKEEELVASLPLLSGKPIIYAANLAEEDFSAGYENNKNYQSVKTIAAAEHAAVMPICAKFEEELSGMEPADKKEFLEELGFEESGLDRMIKESYALLGLMSFLTAGKKEVRAWTIKKGTKAPQAAGVIHTDFERGFIRAEIVKYDDLMRVGSMTAAKEEGLIRSEGKEYVMQDGDIVVFRFNV